MGRIKELDGLRAIAIVAVLTAHFFPPDRANLPKLGWAGVDLFFAISGFLITGVLLRLRATENAFQTFYWRRVLRIFPPYYLVLALIVALALAHGEHIEYPDIVKHGVFLSSLTPGTIKAVVGRLFIHPPSTLLSSHSQERYSLPQFGNCFGVYWSLSVEELFYLIWAPVVLRGSRRLILFCSVGPVLACPLLRALAHTTPHMGESTGFVFRFDSLAAGSCVALLFWGMENGRVRKKIIDRGLPWILLLSFLGVLWLASRGGIWRGVDVRTGWVFSVFGYSLLSLTCASLVATCARWSGEMGALSSVLRSRIAIYVGAVSYTMYLIHLPLYFGVQIAISKIFGPSALNTDRWVMVCGVLATAGTVFAAGLSWRYLEAPILQRKERLFPLRTTRLTAISVRQIETCQAAGR